MMSYPNPYPYIPPPYIHPPMGIPMSAPAPVILSKPTIPVPMATVENNNMRFSAFERPITTVFIGNISEKITDSLMKDVLAKCGNVLSWKRVQGASGKLQAFGFCEYDNPEATLRCIRLLNEFQIADKALVVKVDPKTDELLTDYKNKKQKAIEDREAEDVTRTDEEKKERINLIYAREADEDKNALNQVKKLIKESGSELITNETDKKEKKPEKNEVKNSNIESVDNDGDKKILISREIENFRNKHKDDESNENKEERFKRIRERDKERRRERERERSKEASRHRRHRSKSRSKTNRLNAEEDRQRKTARGDSRSPSAISKKRRSDSKDTHKSSKRSKKDSDKELDEYEAAMIKKLEKKLRDKETAYQKRLQAWEAREKKKNKDYEIEKDRNESKEKEIAEEARKLQIFFEDYDDEKWDTKYYRGTELERRMNARHAEENSDEKDRLKELEQIENTRQRLMREQNPNAEAIILKMEQSMQEHLQKRLKLDLESVPVVSDDDKQQPEPVPNCVTESGSHQPMINSNSDGFQPEELEVAMSSSDTNMTDHHNNSNHHNLYHQNSYLNNSDDNSESMVVKTEATGSLQKSSSNDTSSFKPMVLSSQPAVPIAAGPIADDNTDDQRVAGAAGVNSSGGKSAGLSNVERKQMVKKIIDGIPTIKADLFAHPIEWDMIDESFVELRIKPWVDKKIVAYIGEEEPSLSKFICDQVLDHKTPDQILADIAMVLEEEADVFVMKMWRLLIYVIEEKKAGLDKS